MGTVGLVAAWNLGRSLGLPGEAHLPFNLAMSAVVVGTGVAAGLRSGDLGLARARIGSGLRWGAGTAAVVGAAIAAAASAGPGAGWFDDPRADVTAGELAWRALVVIPVGTVLVEELTFRGALHGLLDRRWGPTVAIAAGGGLFGLWHVVPAWDQGIASVGATLVATTAAGVAFGWLRQRSGSVVAPALAHVATNSGALLAAWLLAH